MPKRNSLYPQPGIFASGSNEQNGDNLFSFGDDDLYAIECYDPENNPGDDFLYASKFDSNGENEYIIKSFSATLLVILEYFENCTSISKWLFFYSVTLNNVVESI